VCAKINEESIFKQQENDALNAYSGSFRGLPGDWCYLRWVQKLFKAGVAPKIV